MKWIARLSPYLVAIFSVTSLYSTNSDRFGIGQVWYSLAFALVVAGILHLLFWLNKWTAHNAALLAAVFTVVILAWHNLLWWMDVGVLISALIIGIIVRSRLKPLNIIVSSALIGIILVNIGYVGVSRIGLDKVKVDEINYTSVEGKPNIYFIIPDRMPSFDAMEESGIDTSELEAHLTELGFYINKSQLSHDEFTPDYKGEMHTTRTMRFFASVLNRGKDIPLDISYKDCRNLINKASIFDGLHQEGYTITNIATWFTETAQLPKADKTYTFKDISIWERVLQSEFSQGYFERTIFAGLNIRAYQSNKSINRIEYKRHLWQAEKLYEAAWSEQTSQFVMAHIMLPHEPFIYSDEKDQLDRYYDQIKFAMGYIDALTKIIRANDPEAIVIIQSDEGMAFRKPVSLNNSLTSTQWNGVFSAWYLPDITTYPSKNLFELKHTDILREIITND